MEFNVRTTPRPIRRAWLYLQDSGSSSMAVPQSTNVVGYSGDGVVTAADWSATGTLVITVTRPNVSGVTAHEVTAHVNARLAAGDAFLGFRLEGAAADSFDAFGFYGQLVIE